MLSDRSNSQQKKPSNSRMENISRFNTYLIAAGVCAATTALLERLGNQTLLGENTAMGNAYLQMSIYTFATSTIGCFGAAALQIPGALFPETTNKVSNSLNSFFSRRNADDLADTNEQKLAAGSEVYRRM